LSHPPARLSSIYEVRITAVCPALRRTRDNHMTGETVGTKELAQDILRLRQMGSHEQSTESSRSRVATSADAAEGDGPFQITEARRFP